MTDTFAAIETVMTRELIVLHEEDNLRRIAEGMDRYQVRHLPVVDDQRLVGILSHRDVLGFTGSCLAKGTVARAQRERLLEVTFVAEVMTRNPRTVTRTTPIWLAADLLVRERYGCLPVVEDDGTLVGIVTRTDLLELLTWPGSAHRAFGLESKAQATEQAA